MSPPELFTHEYNRNRLDPPHGSTNSASNLSLSHEFKNSLDGLNKKLHKTSMLPDVVFRRAAEATSSGIIVVDATDPDHPIIYVNRGFERLTGYEASEVLGRNCRLLQGPKSLPDVRRQMREAIVERTSFQGEILNYRKDGSEFWNSITLSPVIEESGTVRYFVGIQKDVTGMKGAIAERDKWIQELRAVNAGLDRFASLTSHEMKNPLQAMLDYAQMMSEHLSADSSKDVLHALEQLTANAKYLVSCLDELRQFGVLGLSPLKMEEVKISRLVQEVKGILGEGYDFVQCPPDLPQILCNHQLMVQVLRNLIDNAVKHGQACERGLKIDAHMQPNGECTILVRDFGPGLSPDTTDKIFEPFFTTSPHISTGMGLGLAIVKKVVETHGATIKCDSGEEGTTFIIQWPATAAVKDSPSFRPV